jgi:hypothetical protein
VGIYHAKEIWLVCHSLGSRLALESVRHLLDYDPSIFDRTALGIIMMAAAVPVYLMNDATSEGLRRAADKVQPRVVLHSSDDKVLAWLFRVGQAARLLEAFDRRDFWPEAVGLRGGPGGGFWDARSQAMRGYGHSDYWASRDVAEIVVSHLGGPVRPILLEHVVQQQGLLPSAPDLAG